MVLMQGQRKTGNAIDERGNSDNSHVQLDDVGYKGWQYWCKVDNVTYPDKGFVSFNDDIFYYEPTNDKYSEYVPRKKDNRWGRI